MFLLLHMHPAAATPCSTGGGRCCITDADCVALFEPCTVSACVNHTLNPESGFVEGLCEDPIERTCLDPDVGDKCTRGVCNATTGNCTMVPFPTLCDDGNPCTADVCHADTGVCAHAYDWTCCTPDNFDHCYSPGYACREIACDVTANETVGTCSLTAPAPACCESDADCHGGDLCSLAWCNHHANACEDVGQPLQCAGESSCLGQFQCAPATGLCACSAAGGASTPHALVPAAGWFLDYAVTVCVITYECGYGGDVACIRKNECNQLQCCSVVL